jgi:hypothetical protein
MVPEGWASYGFNYLSDFDRFQEDDSPFGSSKDLNKFVFTNFSYSRNLSFYKKGGYVLGIDL